MPLRDKVLKEIILTEESYLKQLHTLDKFFARPCLEKGLLPEGIHAAIFGELPALRHMNEELYKALVSENENVGSAFLHLAPFLKVYSSYAKNYQKSINLLLEWERRSDKLRSWITVTESRPEVQTKLPSLLITPVQRVPRYRLLLGELLKRTSEDHPHYSSIAKAVEEVGEVAEHINRSISKAENLQRMLMIQRAFKRSQPNIIAPGRHLLKEGILHKVSRNGSSSQPRLFFLFTDILLYTKLPTANIANTSTSSSGDVLDVEYKPNSLECCCLLPLRHCSVVSVLGNGQQGLFRLKCESEDMLLYSSDNTGGSKWVSTLIEAVREAVDKRKTLRKDSSSRKPLRRPALRKLTIKGDPEQLIALKVTSHRDENREEVLSPSRLPVPESPKVMKGKAAFKRTHDSPGSLMTQLLQAQDCLTPPKSWLSPSKKHKATPENKTDRRKAEKFKSPLPVLDLKKARVNIHVTQRTPLSFTCDQSGKIQKERVTVGRVTSARPSYSPRCSPQYKPSPLAR
ncbi:rho guanine nucleotide exchange factor 39 isoform X2 [Procambarus clarkii]|uniref:rho guanine nucleotide exchange factor 39 isoform X2 n=1 Tax=Procambarus clarkii TaxID=6728 RepID=UPI001E670A54|nr:putative protein tag-52 [Procambarus clarkii]XP_045595614.1 putative protein tag-52 [Procambarus clarkii]XP_045595615.1 putative protein tag-52 [Procambarus clarkii]